MLLWSFRLDHGVALLVATGLLDQHTHVPDNTQAMPVLLDLAKFIKGRIDALIALKGAGWWETCLNQEFGGMNEVAYSLFSITKDPEHEQLAKYFYKQVFMDPLAANHDSLNGNQCVGGHAHRMAPPRRCAQGAFAMGEGEGRGGV